MRQRCWQYASLTGETGAGSCESSRLPGLWHAAGGNYAVTPGNGQLMEDRILSLGTVSSPARFHTPAMLLPTFTLVRTSRAPATRSGRASGSRWKGREAPFGYTVPTGDSNTAQHCRPLRRIANVHQGKLLAILEIPPYDAMRY